MNATSQTWCPAVAKASSYCQRVYEKDQQKGIFSSILDRFQNDEVFHASQLQHNWTKEWCEYLDYMTTIDISHKASPEQLERFATLYHFRYRPQQMERGPIKSRPDYHQTSRAIVSKEAGQIQESKRRHKYREDLDPEKLDWLRWLSHNWKWYFAVNRISDLNSTQWLHQKSAEAHASGNREAFTNDDRWKANWWTTSWWEKSRWKWNDEVCTFTASLRISHHTVATTVCATGGVHTLCVARTFFWLIFLVWRTDISRTRMAQGVCSAHVISLHLTLSILMFHPPSLLFPDGHFETTFPTLTSAPSLPGRSHALHRIKQKNQTEESNRRIKQKNQTEESNRRIKQKNQTEESNRRTQRRNPTEESNGGAKRRNPTEESSGGIQRRHRKTRHRKIRKRRGFFLQN